MYVKTLQNFPVLENYGIIKKNSFWIGGEVKSLGEQKDVKQKPSPSRKTTPDRTMPSHWAFG